MADLLRDAPFGQLVRLITKNGFFAYPDERPGFQDDWNQIVSNVAEKKPMASGATANTPQDAGVADAIPPGKEDLEADLRLSIIPTARSSDGSVRISTRTNTREATRPFSRERLEVEQQEAAQRQESSIIIPQTTEEGLILVTWYTTDDPENPQNWSSRKKVFVATILCAYTFAVYAASAIYISAIPQIMEKFVIGQTKASLGLAIYVLGYGLGPMIFSPLSEVPAIGRNLPYIITFGLFVILCVPTALANSYGSLIALRFLTGFVGSPALATGGATMSDMYGLLKLPYAMTAWVGAAFSGPALGPLLSGFSVVVKGWRWALWEVLWMSAPVFVVMFLLMPETNADNILYRRAQRLRKLTGNDKLRSQGEINQRNTTVSKMIIEQLWLPTEIAIKDPAIFFTNLYTSLIYAIYYSFFEAFPIVYIGIYGFNLGQLALIFLCITVGTVLGIAIYCAYVYWYLEPDIKKHGLRAQEHRLVPALVAVFLLPVGLFWYGWTQRASIHWFVGLPGLTLFPLGSFVLFQCIFMYLPLSYPQYSASLFAANDLCRSALAAGAVLFGHPLYVNLGVPEGISVLGGLTVAGVIGIWAIWYYGADLRARSRFAQK
ncbi:hypothetical protein B0A52_00676 [Exophiala mesophila]|uniref:Major facilitator superfamily (MFS) profile domain-containing protein n=1 Tax=Exophiala mesophila TaxID=212818 RepID=A0A438NHW8_EXOME|nr:hypothetical protein B0A52_00676 [Exophiala mesophila]